MNAKRIQLLVAMLLLLTGCAGLVHTALEQTQAQASATGVVVVEPSIAEIEPEITNISALAQTELESGDPGTPNAPLPPIAPTPPPAPEVVVDLVSWVGWTVVLFTPFALFGWYLDQRSRSAMYEGPLA